MANAEARMPNEAPMANPDDGNFVIRNSSLIRHSGFVIRHCRAVLLRALEALRGYVCNSLANL